MNEKGYSWPEAVLTLAVVMLIFGSLLPYSLRLKDQLERKKVSMYAAETLFHATFLHHSYGYQHGKRFIGNVTFEWEYTDNKLCVHYDLQGKGYDRCIEN